MGQGDNVNPRGSAQSRMPQLGQTSLLGRPLTHIQEPQPWQRISPRAGGPHWVQGAVFTQTREVALNPPGSGT